jgi:hypothetical protein
MVKVRSKIKRSFMIKRMNIFLTKMQTVAQKNIARGEMVE